MIDGLRISLMIRYWSTRKKEKYAVYFTNEVL